MTLLTALPLVGIALARPAAAQDHLPKPRPDGQAVLYLTPPEFLERLAALIPPHASTGIAITVCWLRMLPCVPPLRPMPAYKWTSPAVRCRIG